MDPSSKRPEHHGIFDLALKMIHSRSHSQAIQALEALNLSDMCDGQALEWIDTLAGLYLLEQRYIDVPALLEPVLERFAGQQPGLLAKLATAWRNLGHPDRAIIALRQALEFDASNADLTYNLGNALRDAGLLEEACSAFEQSISQGLNDPKVYNNLGIVLRDLGQLVRAEAVFSQGLTRDPQHRALAFNMSALLADRNDFAASLAVLRCLPFHEDDVELLLNLALSLDGAGHPSEAIKLFERVLEHDPIRSDVLSALGASYQATGHIQQAIEAYESALSIDPFNMELHRRKSVCYRYKEGDRHLGLMRSFFSQEDLDHDSRMRLCFALAKAEEEAANYRQAFLHLQEANRLMASSITPFDLHGWIYYVLRILECDRALIRQACSVTYPQKGKGLVFIVGMPRSGTTLTENILSMTPGAVDLGETMALQRCISDMSLFMEAGDGPSVADLELLGDMYLERIGFEPSSQRLITDKNLYNWRYAGLIARAFPGAKIIYSKRNPMDNLLSIYKAYFPQGNEYAFDLQQIFQVYQLHDQVITQYLQRYRSQIMISNYDDLVRDPNLRIPELVGFVGQEWRDDYLSPELSQRQVRTASAVQVRQPIHPRSVGGWRRYEPELQHVAQRFKDLGYSV